MENRCILNGVDVEKCWYIHGVSCKNKNYASCDERLNLCDEHPNCYFKQLARAKDKINYMEEGIKIVENARDDFEREVMQKEQECEKLKTQLMQNSEVNTFFNTPIKGWSNDPCKVCPYKQDYQAKDQECEELKEKLDKYLNQEEEEIRQLNNDNKLDEILESIKKANEQMAKEIKYKKALEAIEAYCNVTLADRCHYSEGTILMAEKLMREYISKTKDGE